VSKPLIEFFVANNSPFSFAFFPNTNVKHCDFQLPMTACGQNKIVEISLDAFSTSLLGAIARARYPPYELCALGGDGINSTYAAILRCFAIVASAQGQFGPSRVPCIIEG